MGGPEFSISSATLRIVLRAYFTIVLLLLSIIGNQCCRQRVRYRVLKRQNFSLTDMTGWLNGFDVPWTMWSLGTSPSGWLGYLMIFAGLYGIASDLAVSGLVVTENAVSRCPFNTSGPYVVEMQNTPMSLTIEPAPFGATYQMVSQARLTSLQNGGLAGIYGKVNGDPSFRADSSDVIGQWKCQVSGSDISFPVNASFDSIYRELDSQQLVFTEYWSGCDDLNGDNISGRFLLWTTSTLQPADPAEPWEFRAAVDMTTDVFASPQVMRPFLCQMNAPTLEVILAHTSVDWSFTSWCEEVRGQIYSDLASVPNSIADPGPVLESVLDNLVMTAGSSWNLTLNPILVPSQGCLVARTKVSWVVVILFVLVTISTIGMIIYWIVLSILIRRASASRLYSPQQIEHIEEYTPNGLLSWMVQAVRETGLGKVGFRDLKEWSFGWHVDKQRTGLMRKAGVGAYGYEPVRL